jgi:hypothetical protein
VKDLEGAPVHLKRALRERAENEVLVAIATRGWWLSDRSVLGVAWSAPVIAAWLIWRSSEFKVLAFAVLVAMLVAQGIRSAIIAQSSTRRIDAVVEILRRSGVLEKLGAPEDVAAPS